MKTRNEEDLNELLRKVLPIESEVAFYNFIADMRDGIERLDMRDGIARLRPHEILWSPTFLLKSSIAIINSIVQDEAKSSLQYTLAKAGHERAAALIGYDQGAAIQRIFDFRKKLMDEIPELEQLFLEELW